MIIAGNCLYIDDKDTDEILETAKQLKGIATHFRCKVWGGGTNADIFFPGAGTAGLDTLNLIDKTIMPTGTEVQIPEHIGNCNNDLSYIWLGARNSQNYGLLRYLQQFNGDVMIKRNAGMTIAELVGIYDICKHLMNKQIYVIERGVNTFDRRPDLRWRPDILGAIELKVNHPDIFDRYIVDCSHSCFHKEFVGEVYTAFKSVGVQHFMFEAMAHPEKARTDKAHMLSVKELEEIIK